MISPYFTLAEAADFLRFSTPKACREWLRRQRIPIVKRGRAVLVLRVSIDEALMRGSKRLRRAS